MAILMIILGVIAAVGIGSGFAFAGGRASAFKAIAKETPAATGSGVLTGLFNMLFGDVSGLINKAIYWVILVVLLYLIIRILMNWSKNRKVSRVKYSDQHTYHHKD